MITATSSLVDVAFAVGTALERAGITAVLTGGSAATFYAPDAYQSSDLDFLITLPRTGGMDLRDPPRQSTAWCALTGWPCPEAPPFALRLLASPRRNHRAGTHEPWVEQLRRRPAQDPPRERWAASRRPRTVAMP